MLLGLTDVLCGSSSDATSSSIQSSAEQQEDIPWPALADFSPSNLRMTAPVLMSEWEKSLEQPATPKPVQSVKAASLKKAKKAD